MSMSVDDKTINYTIRAQSYISHVRHNPLDLISMKRTQSYAYCSKLIDAYGPIWVVGFCDQPKSKVSIKSGNTEIILTGKCGYFAPEFSLLAWTIGAGDLNWEGCTSHLSPPRELLKKPFVFDWNGSSPRSFKELIEILMNAKNKIYIEEQTRSSALAEKAKKYIDANYLNSLAISEIAEKFDYAWGFMSREFKRVYHLSPVAYRHRIRLFHAIQLLSLGYPVTDACYASGFKSLTQFNTHFKKIMGTQPHNYVRKK